MMLDDMPGGICSPIESALRAAGGAKTTRREFAKVLGCAVLAGAGVAAARPLLAIHPTKATEALAVAVVGEIAIGGYKLIRYPTPNDPCIVVRLAAERYAAYSQNCTHLQCPVHFQPEKNQLYCPCHEGVFRAEDGAVLAGPPRRPLPRFAVEIRDGRIWVKAEPPSTPSPASPSAHS